MGAARRMIELVVFGIIAILLFGVVYYQNYRDKSRWARIESGMSLFGDRSEVPNLEWEGHTFNSHNRKVLVVWNDLTQSTCGTVSDARIMIDKEAFHEKQRAANANIFVWDGKQWSKSK